MRRAPSKSALILALLLCAPGFVLPRQARVDGFRYQRAIVPGGPGPNRLDIDVSLLAGASPFREFSRIKAGDDQGSLTIAKGGLGDLRIHDASGREIPYLLVATPSPEPRWSEGRILPLAAAEKTSGFEVDLGQSLRVDRLRLAGIPPPFLKRFRLEAGGDRSRWTVLVAEGTLFDLPAEKLKRLELDCEPGEYRYLRITWDDAASARVALPVSASARLIAPGSLPPPLRAPLQFDPRPGEPGTSRYRLRLPGSNLPIRAIEIAAAGGSVLRRARVSEGRLVDNEMVPEMLGIATLWHTVRGSASAAELLVPIAPPSASQLELTIQNGDNPPLELTGISAVFAHLPWIYFESPGKAPLTARYGDRDLAAPLYDLEAARAAIEKLHPAAARWGDVIEKPTAESAISDLVLAAGAKLDTAAFRYARKIPDAKPGLNALLLDAEILAHTRLSDLRIVGTDASQIPYLLERQEGPLVAKLPALEKMQLPGLRAGVKRQSSGSQSFYRLTLPFNNLPAGRLVLTTSARVFRREVAILLEKNPSNERHEPWTHQVVSETWSHADPDTPAPALVLPLPSLEVTEAGLIIEEGDNRPLPLESASLLLPSYRMRFFRRVGAELNLYYGNDGIDAPRYDLALLSPYLVGAAAEEISFSPENPLESGEPETRPASILVFWIILGLAVIVLLALIARLLKKNGPASP